MASVHGFVFALSALFVLLCTSPCAADCSHFEDEVQEEMCLAQARGAQWLQGKREEANLMVVKATSLIQTATLTQQKLIKSFAPNGKVIQRTIGTFKAGGAKSKEGHHEKPTFNPFMPK